MLFIACSAIRVRTDMEFDEISNKVPGHAGSARDAHTRLLAGRLARTTGSKFVMCVASCSNMYLCTLSGITAITSSTTHCTAAAGKTWKWQNKVLVLTWTKQGCCNVIVTFVWVWSRPFPLTLILPCPLRRSWGPAEGSEGRTCILSKVMLQAWKDPQKCQLCFTVSHFSVLIRRCCRVALTPANALIHRCGPHTYEATQNSVN